MRNGRTLLFNASLPCGGVLYENGCAALQLVFDKKKLKIFMANKR